MSIISEYREAKAQLEALQAQLKGMEDNEALLQEMEFEEKLRSLMAEYKKSLRDIIAIIDPQTPSVGIKPAGKRPRAKKVYKNPHSGEVVETKGGNHKVLKAWKQQYGSDTVESWLA